MVASLSDAFQSCHADAHVWKPGRKKILSSFFAPNILGAKFYFGERLCPEECYFQFARRQLKSFRFSTIPYFASTEKPLLCEVDVVICMSKKINK